MSTTTLENEKKRLRSYLNPYIKGPNTDSILEALSSGPAYLVDSIRAVNDMLYIATAQGQYLDERLAEFNITRPPAVGIDDSVFREIGIEVKNRKQVRDLINKLLNAIFGDEFVRASSLSKSFEPYNLQDGDTLIINFDNKNTIPIIFKTGDFQNIAAASAQEVADSISKTLRRLGKSGTAIAKNDGNGYYVEILSDTIGPASSVTVFGGRAQNELRFDTYVPTTANMSTQWTLSIQSGGLIRFTWSGGADPQIGKVSVGHYVNIFGGGFLSSANEGSFIVTNSNGLDLLTEITFTLINNLNPGDYFSFNGTTLIAVASGAISGQFNIGLNSNITAANLSAAITKLNNFESNRVSNVVYVNTDFTNPQISYTPIGASNVSTTSSPFAGSYFEVYNPLGTSGIITQGIDNAVLFYNPIKKTIAGRLSYAAIYQTELNVLQIFIPATTKVVRRDRKGSAHLHDPADPISLLPDQPGPYCFDLSQPFTVSSIRTNITQDLDGSMPKTFSVADSSAFPDEQGYLILDYGSQNQEGPIPYIARPSSTTLLLSPAYTLKKAHTNGADVSFISAKFPVKLSNTGDDYAFYITGITEGRVYAQDLINSVTAAGINVVYVILFPSDQGLGKFGTQYSEIVKVYE